MLGMKKWHTCFEGPDAVALPHDSSGCGRDGGEREVVREAVVVGLLGFPEEETRVEYRVVRLYRAAGFLGTGGTECRERDKPS